MSLINDMLQDLDVDQGKSKPTSIGSQSVVSSSPIRFKSFLLPTMAILAIAYFLIVEFNVFGVMPERQQLHEVPKPIAMNPKWLAVASDDGKQSTTSIDTSSALTVKSIPIESAITVDVVMPAVSEPSVVTHSEANAVAAEKVNNHAIDILLGEGRLALQEDRLMTPESRSAFQLFHSVLLLDAENTSAKQGLKAVHARYLELAHAAEQRGQDTLNRHYLQRANQISPVGETLRSHTLKRSEPSYVPREARTAGSMDISETAKPNDGYLAGRIRTNYQTSLKDQLIKEVTLGHPMPLATVALADHLARANDIDSLTQFSMALFNINSNSQPYVAAQAAIVAGDLDKVKGLLAGLNSSDKIFIPSLRLLSAICQKQQDFTCAIKGYQQLVNSSEAQASDWLGFAVSLDNVGNSQGALQAYRKIENAGHSDPRVVRYIRQRIGELSNYTYGR